MGQGFGPPGGYRAGDLARDPQVPPYDPSAPFAPTDFPPTAGWKPRAAATRRRHWTWIVPLVVASLVIGLFAYIAVHDPFPDDAKTTGRALRLPSRVDEYVQLRSYDTGKIRDRLASLPVGLGGSGDALAEFAVVGAYATSATAATPQLVFVAFPLYFVPTLSDQVHDLGTATVVKQVMAGPGLPGGDVQEVDPGRLGGAMSCLQVRQLGVERACARGRIARSSR